MGKKRMFPTPESMQVAIDEYFKDCEGHLLTDDAGKPIFNKFGEPVYVGVKPLTVTGLALALGFTSRQALLNYQDRKDYQVIVEKAKLKIENYAEMRLYDKDGWAGAKFNLQNNYKKWDADKAAQDDRKAPVINIINDIPRPSGAEQGAIGEGAPEKPDG